MASTTWLPRLQVPGVPKKTWLLTDNSMVEEPPLEETSTGLKVRVPGTKLSGYMKDLDEILFLAVKEVAHARGASVWMAVEDIDRQVNYDRSAWRAPTVHLLKGGHKYGDETIFWWAFKHPKLPIEAMLTIRISAKYGSSAKSLSQDIETYLTMPNTDPDHAQTPQWFNDGSVFGKLRACLDTNARHALELLIRNGTSWDAEGILGNSSASNERAGVIAVLQQVRKVDSLVSIEIPDLQDPENPQWMTLELHDTNMRQDILSAFTDYLDGAPLVEEAMQYYEQMLKTLRSCGMVLDGATKNTFLAAAAGGNEELTVSVATTGRNGEPEPDHFVTMHLPTGTFTVSCTRPSNEIATRWEEAATLASLTGQEDVLLAYARSYVEQQHAEKSKSIIRARGGSQ